MLPSDCTSTGIVFGGVVMKLMDNAAGIAASRHCRSNVVTASLDALDCMALIHNGDLVHVTATPLFTSSRSLEIEVRETWFLVVGPVVLRPVPRPVLRSIYEYPCSLFSCSHTFLFLPLPSSSFPLLSHDGALKVVVEAENIVSGVSSVVQQSPSPGPTPNGSTQQQCTFLLLCAFRHSCLYFAGTVWHSLDFIRVH